MLSVEKVINVKWLLLVVLTLSKGRIINSKATAVSAHILDSVSVTVFADCGIVLSMALRLSAED